MWNENATCPPGEPESPAEQLVRKTPWWSISIGLHVLAALILGWLIVFSPPAETIEILHVDPPQLRPPIPEDFHPAVPAVNPILDPDARKVENPIDTMDRDMTTEDIGGEFTGREGNPEHAVKAPFDSKNRTDSIGLARAGAGRKGGPFRGRKLQSGRGSAGPRTRTDEAVLSALLWLARHQSPDGSWGVQTYLSRCKGGACTPNPSSASADFDTGVTGLSILAFLGAGYSHLSKDTHVGFCFGDVVRKGLQWMIARQDPDGFLGLRSGHKAMYNHAICTLAICEAYGLTFSNLLRENAQRAVDCLVAAQNPGRGWRYHPRCGDSDTSVTGWAVMALKSAELSDLVFPPSAYEGARAWLDEVTEESYGRAGYNRRGTGKVYCPHNPHFDHREALTAIAVMSRIFIDRNPRDAAVRNGAALLTRDLPAWDGAKIDFYSWYYEALALFQFDGPNGPLWSKWNRSMVEALVKPQNLPSNGCKNGSWEPVDRWSCEGGRVYATAINALTLEVYYRYDRVFTGKDR